MHRKKRADLTDVCPETVKYPLREDSQTSVYHREDCLETIN